MALDHPREATHDMLPPQGTVDRASIATVAGNEALCEIKEEQVIMDYLRNLSVDEGAAKVRSIRAG